MAGRIEGDFEITGDLAVGSMTLPTGGVTNSTVAAAAAISATKVVGRTPAVTDFGVDSDVAPSADVKVVVYRAKAAATVRGYQVGLLDTGSSTDVKFDLLKASAGSPTGTTILSATLDFTDADTDNTVKSGSISSTALVAGDVLIAHMDYTSATGALGPYAIAEVDEAAT